jgi:hypothetical protein
VAQADFYLHRKQDAYCINVKKESEVDKVGRDKAD